MKKILAFICLITTLVSCGTTSNVVGSKTRGQQYPGMYDEKPVAIAVMPPINRTTHAEAKEYFYTTLYRPLCEKGYYVFSPALTMEMFQQESAYDAEMFLEGNLDPFRNVLGADAAMFTIIKDWSKSSVGGIITVRVEYILRSTKSGNTLYKREGRITVDTNVDGGDSDLGFLVGMIATAVNTATTDHVVAGRRCTAYVLSDLPVGKYSPISGEDQDRPAGNSFVEATLK